VLAIPYRYIDLCIYVSSVDKGKKEGRKKEEGRRKKEEQEEE
jgi:hypothetical protein